MGLASFMSQSDKIKGWFTNAGFDAFGSVQYAMIGARAPETALDSVGTRFDADFIEDDFGDSPPQLMSYTDRDRDRDRDSRDRDRDRGGEEVQMPRRLDTAAASVPKLQAPPGGA